MEGDAVDIQRQTQAVAVAAYHPVPKVGASKLGSTKGRYLKLFETMQAKGQMLI